MLCREGKGVCKQKERTFLIGQSARYTVMRSIMTFRSVMDNIHDGGPIRILLYIIFVLEMLL